MTLFRLLFAIDAIAALILLYFFFVGLADGSVSSFNMTLWMTTLIGVGAVLLGGYGLNRNGNARTAKLLLSVLAIPACCFAVFFLIIIIAQPRWN